MNETRKRNRRGEGVRLREDIVHAAADLLEEHGNEEAVTLRAIARRVGIAAPSIYAHFTDRDEILFAVLEEAFQALDAALVGSGGGIGDPVERLHAMGRAYVEFSREQPHRYRILFGQEGLIPSGGQPAPLPPPLPDPECPEEDADPDERVGGTAFDRLVSAIQGCIDAGRSESKDAWSEAMAVWVGIHGYCTLRSSTPGFPWADDDHLVVAMTERLALLR